MSWRHGVAGAMVLAACAKPPAAPEPQPVVVAPASAEPESQPEPPAPVSDAAPAANGDSVGIQECDQYLALYRECEPKLAQSIAAGDRRSYRSERGWIEYMKSSSEAPELPAACRSLLDELESACR